MTANDVLPHISISKNLFYIIRISIQYKYMYVRRFFFKPAHSLLFHSPLRPFVRHLREMKECQGLFSEKLWISFGCMGNLYNKESATTTRENNFETSRKKKNDKWLCAFARLRFYTEPYACKRATIYRRQVTAVSSQPRAILAHSFAVVFPISLYIAVLRRSEIWTNTSTSWIISYSFKMPIASSLFLSLSLFNHHLFVFSFISSPSAEWRFSCLCINALWLCHVPFSRCVRQPRDLRQEPSVSRGPPFAFQSSSACVYLSIFFPLRSARSLSRLRWETTPNIRARIVCSQEINGRSRATWKEKRERERDQQAREYRDREREWQICMCTASDFGSVISSLRTPSIWFIYAFIRLSLRLSFLLVAFLSPTYLVVFLSTPLVSPRV